MTRQSALTFAEITERDILEQGSRRRTEGGTGSAMASSIEYLSSAQVAASNTVALYEVLENLHTQRREMLDAKRRNSLEFDPSEYEQLVAYIREVEAPIVELEERREAPAVDRLSSLSDRLTELLKRT